MVLVLELLGFLKYRETSVYLDIWSIYVSIVITGYAELSSYVAI